ncbi:hypothetical protein B4099_2411 [Heyndrickxia coagulans]|uniref:Core domain-containing protein n=5 Tax=Heyndrickxia TaxID=2837504 RepID=A0A150KD83_HEYCO|nr:hypothetical protein B4099_2411 [Heyndrickxia coagulans]
MIRFYGSVFCLDVSQFFTFCPKEYAIIVLHGVNGYNQGKEVRIMSEVIHLTEAAAFQIKDMMEQNDEQDAYFRVSVNGGGCSGLSYGLSLDHEIKEGDAVGEQHGIRILVDHESAPILTGTVIDYKQSLLGGGFTIDNPNAIVTCGCGSSFKTKTKAGTPEKC